MEACKRGTQKQKQRVEEQQLGLTVVLLPLNFYSYHLPAQKESYFSIHSQAGIICTVFPSTVSSFFSFSVMM